jgi:hypothetical protein
MTSSWAQVLVAVLKYVLGPVVAALIGLYAGMASHSTATTGYRVLAQNYNEQVMSKLIELDSRLDVIEKKTASVPATQPVIAIRPAGPVLRPHVAPVARVSGTSKIAPEVKVVVVPPTQPPKFAPMRMKLKKIPMDISSFK